MCEIESVKKATTIKPEHIVSVCLPVAAAADDDSNGNSNHNDTMTVCVWTKKQEYMHDYKWNW